MLKYKHDIVSLMKIYIKMFSLKYMYSEIINYIYFFEALDLVLAFSYLSNYPEYAEGKVTMHCKISWKTLNVFTFWLSPFFDVYFLCCHQTFVLTLFSLVQVLIEKVEPSSSTKMLSGALTVPPENVLDIKQKQTSLPFSSGHFLLHGK